MDVEITATDTNIRVKCDAMYVDVIRTLGTARYLRISDTWVFPRSPMTAFNIHKQFKARGATVHTNTHFDILLTAARGFIPTEEVRTSTTLAEYPSKTVPWNHQKQAYWFAKEKPGVALFMSMGTGKSKVAVDLVWNRQHMITLIVCPKSVMNVWPREFRTHAAGTVDVTILDGPVKTRAATLQAAVKGFAGVPLVFVTNYESVWLETFAAALLKVKWDCVILDESHRAKAPGGKQSMFLSRLGARAKYRMILTGTPMPKGPLDVYAQYRFLDPGIFGSNYQTFKRTYAVLNIAPWGEEIVGYQNQADLQERIYRVAVRADQSLLDLPDTQDIERNFQLAPTARKSYDNLEKSAVTKVEGGLVSANNALTMLLRLQQMTSGFVLPVGEDGKPTGKVQELDSGKRDLLEDLLQDTSADEPIVVFTRFHHDLDVVKTVCEKAGRRYGELSGRRNDLSSDATYPEGVDVMGVQIQSGGVGIDLTRARYAVFYSLGFSLGDYEQARARVHRPGQKRPVVYFHFKAAGTVDDDVYAALKSKKEVVRAIIDSWRAGSTKEEEEGEGKEINWTPLEAGQGGTQRKFGRVR